METLSDPGPGNAISPVTPTLWLSNSHTSTSTHYISLGASKRAPKSEKDTANKTSSDPCSSKMTGSLEGDVSSSIVPDFSTSVARYRFYAKCPVFNTS